MRRSSRGFSLLETMMAGAVMFVGLVGITTLLLRSAANTRDGTSAINGSVAAYQAISEIQAGGFTTLALVAAGSDAGVVTDSSGRKYYCTQEVTPSDAGAANGYQVQVLCAWRDSNGVDRVNQATTVVTKVPVAP